MSIFIHDCIECQQNNHNNQKSQTATIQTFSSSTNNHLVRVPTRVVSPRPNTYDPQSYSDTSPRRNITFNFHSNSDDEIQNETQNITSFRNTSVDVSSLTRTILDTTHNISTTRYINTSYI